MIEIPLAPMFAKSFHDTLVGTGCNRTAPEKKKDFGFLSQSLFQYLLLALEATECS